MSALSHSPERDRAWGRYFAKRGAARVLREAERPVPNSDRVLAWRNRAREPGIGNGAFTPLPSSRAPSCVPPAHSGWAAFF